jgi:hypothetical protein
MPENVTSLTAPLNLRQFLKTPDTRIDPVPFLDLLLIGLFFGLFNSQFILPPGLTIDLPRSNASAVTGTPVTAVITLLPPAPSDTQSLGFVLFRATSSDRSRLKERSRATSAARARTSRLCCW